MEIKNIFNWNRKQKAIQNFESTIKKDIDSEKEQKTKQEEINKKIIDYHNSITDDDILNQLKIESDKIVERISNAFIDENDFNTRKRLYKLNIRDCNPIEDIINGWLLFNEDYARFQSFKSDIINLSNYCAISTFRYEPPFDNGLNDENIISSIQRNDCIISYLDSKNILSKILEIDENKSFNVVGIIPCNLYTNRISKDTSLIKVTFKFNTDESEFLIYGIFKP